MVLKSIAPCPKGPQWTERGGEREEEMREGRDTDENTPVKSRDRYDNGRSRGIRVVSEAC